MRTSGMPVSVGLIGLFCICTRSLLILLRTSEYRDQGVPPAANQIQYYTRSLLTLLRASGTRGCPWQRTRSSTPFSAGPLVLRSKRSCKKKMFTGSCLVKGSEVKGVVYLLIGVLGSKRSCITEVVYLLIGILG